MNTEIPLTDLDRGIVSKPIRCPRKVINIDKDGGASTNQMGRILRWDGDIISANNPERGKPSDSQRSQAMCSAF